MRIALFLAAALVAPSPCPAQQEVLATDGVRIRYAVRGQGTPVLLVHGFSANAEVTWGVSGIADSLAPRFTVIMPDLRGHGRSGKPHDPAAYGARFVDDLLALLDHLDVRRAHVVGYSMGAFITLRLLTSHPERVMSAVLAGGGWRPPGEPPPRQILEWLDGLERAAADGTSITDVLWQPHWPEPWPETRAALDANDPRALAAVLRGMGGVTVTEAALQGNAVPVLAVVGAADSLAANDVARMARVMGNLEITIIPDADHLSALTDPRLARAVAAFLRSHD
jgi:pimeloyl-ACP methyl ester carboxylesterase